jgi:hypothetical protein
MDEETQELVPAAANEALEVEARLAELTVQIISIMDRIAQTLALESPHPSTARRVRGARTVPREFVVALTALVEWMPSLGRTYDTAEAHDVLGSTDAYQQLTERASLLLASLKYTTEARWASVVDKALLTFSIASIQAKDPKNGELAARIEHLSQLLGRKGTKRKRKEKKDDPAP